MGEYRGLVTPLVVKTSGWQSFDRQFDPTSVNLWRRPCGVAWDAVPKPMIEYIDPDFLLL
jgi:hypothetical protein